MLVTVSYLIEGSIGGICQLIRKSRISRRRGDYPYFSHADRVNSIELFNVLGHCAPDAVIRRKILVDNPQRLFGF